MSIGPSSAPVPRRLMQTLPLVGFTVFESSLAPYPGQRTGSPAPARQVR